MNDSPGERLQGLAATRADSDARLLTVPAFVNWRLRQEHIDFHLWVEIISARGHTSFIKQFKERA